MAKRKALAADRRRSIVRVEVSLPEARRAVESFAKNRAAAVEAFVHDVREGASEALNKLLNAEMDMFLGEPEQGGNKRNGFQRVREYHLKGLGGLQVRIPRDRLGGFQSSVVPAGAKLAPQRGIDPARCICDQPNPVGGSHVCE